MKDQQPSNVPVVVSKQVTRIINNNVHYPHFYAVGVIHLDYDSALEDARFLADKDRIIKTLIELGRPWGVI